MKLDVVGHRRIYLSISAALIIASLLLFFIQGLNFGVDFTGGTLLERSVPGTASVAAIEEVMAVPALTQFDLGTSFVQPLESEQQGESVFLIRTRSEAGSAPVRAIDEALAERFGDVTVRRTEVVGPVIGEELKRQALWALVFAAIGMLVYVSLRFEYRFAVVAVSALLHDVIIVIGVLALLGTEVNTSFIAAILTVVGYSINDTIIIFDRIREHVQRGRQKDLGRLVNTSINQTLGRSVNTSVTTLFVAGALFLFGGPSIKDFTLTLLLGIIIGTYSSIFLASPLWFEWRKREGNRAKAGST